MKKYSGEPAPLLPILHNIQKQFGYLPRPALKDIAEKLSIAESTLYGTITFYHYFKLAPPPSKPVVKICGGLPCKMSGAEDIKKEIEKAGFTAEAVPCVGMCDKAPWVKCKKREFHNAQFKEIVKALKKAKWKP